MHAGSLPSCPGCNVVLVSFDALRADRLGTYGYTKPTSPAIDAFARHATVFERCLSQSATTVSAVPAMLTGRFPVTDNLLDGITLRPSEETIATVLKRAGYRTLAVISHTFAGCKYSGCRGVDVVSDATPQPEPVAPTIARALRVLDGEARPPFFLWVHVRFPHSPYDAGAAEFARMDDGDGGPTFFSPGFPARTFFRTFDALVARYRARGEPVTTMDVVNGQRRDTTPSVVRQIRAFYDANVRFGDEAFGRILRDLKRRKWLARSVVIVAADHGEALGERGMIGHNTLLYPMLHTPLIVYVPGRHGRRSTAPVMNVDILPTIARVVGVPLPNRVRGHDVFEPRGPDAVQYAEYVRRHVVVGWPFKIDVSTMSWNALKKVTPRDPNAHEPVRYEMVPATKATIGSVWDIEHDPGETVDHAADEHDLSATLERLGEDLVKEQLVTEPRPQAEEIFDKLKALGYVERDPTSPH